MSFYPKLSPGYFFLNRGTILEHLFFDPDTRVGDSEGFSHAATESVAQKLNHDTITLVKISTKY